VVNQIQASLVLDLDRFFTPFWPAGFGFGPGFDILNPNGALSGMSQYLPIGVFVV